MNSMTGFCHGVKQPWFKYLASGYILSSESDERTCFWLQLLLVSQKRAFRPPFMNKCDQMRNWAYYLRVCVCVCVLFVLAVLHKQRHRNSPEGAVMILWMNPFRHNLTVERACLWELLKGKCRIWACVILTKFTPMHLSHLSSCSNNLVCLLSFYLQK